MAATLLERPVMRNLVLSPSVGFLPWQSNACLENHFLLLPHLCSLLCENIVLRLQIVSLCIPPVYAH